MPECPHGMDPAWCSLCKHGPEHPNLVRPTPVFVEVLIDAKFDGQCDVCDLPIHVGQRIGKLSTGKWIHAWCWTEPQAGAA